MVAMSYRPVDRDQAFLLPPSMTDWLPDDHVVWFVIEAVGRIDTAAFHGLAKRGGVGRAGYDPDMLLALLVYALAHGVDSSRRIERQCETDLAFKIICAGDVPDHTVVARFRQRHAVALEDLLTQVLVLCAQLGMVRLGVVAFDGTKIAGNASAGKNHTEDHLRKLARRHLEQTAANDAAEDALFGDARGDELPEQVRDRSGRGRRIKQALEQAEQANRAAEQAESEDQAAAQAYVRDLADPDKPMTGKTPNYVDPVEAAQARLERQIALAERRIAQHQAKAEAAAAQGRRLRGEPPVQPHEHSRVKASQARLERAQTQQAGTEHPLPHTPPPQAKVNVTDPESRILKTRNGWVQGYNCQTAVSCDGFILTARATQDANDTAQFIPTARAVQDLTFHLREHTGRDDLTVGVMVGDAGYDTEDNLETEDLPDRLIANAKRHKLAKRAQSDPAHGTPPAQATTREKMDHRLRTPDGHALYKRRAPLVEAPNAWLKDGRGLRNGFSRRGLTAAHSQLNFAAAVTNLVHLFHRGVTTTQLAT